MTNVIDLRVLADQFLTDRNWYQFHNPKNDAMNIMVEVGELAEHFVVPGQVFDKVADEIADVLFASFCFAQVSTVDIAHSVGTIVGNPVIKDSDSLYEQVQELVLQNVEKFNIKRPATPQQIILSLTNHASQLADIFVWCTPEESIMRAQEQQSFVERDLAHIVAHLIVLSSLLNIHVPTAYAHKMRSNAVKYPVQKSSAQGYIEIKDRSRGRNKN